MCAPTQADPSPFKALTNVASLASWAPSNQGQPFAGTCDKSRSRTMTFVETLVPPSRQIVPQPLPLQNLSVPRAPDTAQRRSHGEARVWSGNGNRSRRKGPRAVTKLRPLCVSRPVEWRQSASLCDMNLDALQRLRPRVGQIPLRLSTNACPSAWLDDCETVKPVRRLVRL